VEEEEEAREIALMDPHIKRGARAWHEHLGFHRRKNLTELQVQSNANKVHKYCAKTLLYNSTLKL
jgi:hypothetical protein